MRHMYRILLALIVAALLVVTGPASADLGPLQVGSGVPVLKPPHTSVRMDSMDVIIRLKGTSYGVDAVFHFFNTGRSTTEWVGFPQRGDVPAFTRFEAWVDGRKAKVWQEPSWVYMILILFKRLFSRSFSDDRWMMQQVTFLGNRGTTIRVSYETSYLQNKSGDRTVIYEYGTGYHWKERIGVAAITINGADVGGAKGFILPYTAGWRRLITGNAVRLEATDYKPIQSLETLRVYLAH